MIDRLVLIVVIFNNWQIPYPVLYHSSPGILKRVLIQPNTTSNKDRKVTNIKLVFNRHNKSKILKFLYKKNPKRHELINLGTILI